MAADWTKVFEKAPRGQPPTQRWQWFDTTGKYEEALYPGTWMPPTAICAPPNMGHAVVDYGNGPIKRG